MSCDLSADTQDERWLTMLIWLHLQNWYGIANSLTFSNWPLNYTHGEFQVFDGWIAVPYYALSANQHVFWYYSTHLFMKPTEHTHTPGQIAYRQNARTILTSSTSDISTG